MGARRLPDGRLPVLLSAHAEDLIAADAQAVADYLDRFPATTVTQVARHLCRTRRVRRYRAVLRAADRSELVDALRALAAGEDHPLVARSAVSTAPRQAFVVPGQGGQWPGMGAAAYVELPAYRAAVDECAAAFEGAGSISPLGYLMAANDDGFSEVEIEGAQFAHAVGLAEVWRSCGVLPDLIVGHSLGEVAAAYVAGTITLPDAAAVVTARADVVGTLPDRYAVAALGVTEQVAQELVERTDGWLELSVVNAPSTVAVSGERRAVRALVDAVQAEGTFAREITAGFPAHTSALEQLRENLLDRLPDSQFVDAPVQFIGGTTGDLVHAGTAFGDYWYANLRNTVRFDRAIESAIRCGATSFIELSASPVLMFAMAQIFEGATGLPEGPAVLVGPQRKGESLLEALSAGVVTAAVADPGYPWTDLLGDAPAQRPGLRGFPNAPMRAVRIWAHPEPLPPATGPATGLTVAAERWDQVAPAPATGRRSVAVVDLGADGELHGSLCAAVDSHPATELRSSQDAELVLVIAPRIDCVAPDKAVAALADLVGTGLLDYPTELGPRCQAVCLVTVGAEQVQHTDPLPNAGHAALAAMHRSIGFDHPEQTFLHLDLPSWELVPTAGRAVVEASLAGAAEAALRRGVIWTRAVGDLPAAPPWPLDTGILDEVVITGGAGAIGMHYARYLAERGARRIVLLSRRGADAAALTALAAVYRTEVLAPPCDITDQEQLSLSAKEYGGSGASLLIHAAGTATFDTAAVMTPDGVTDTCAGKVVGLARMLELWPVRPDARILLCSSISGVMGGRAHGAYSAANRLLDVMAARLRADGRRCVAVRYGLWQSAPEDGGSRGIMNAAALTQIERSGLRPMVARQAIEASLRDHCVDPLVFAADAARFQIFLGDTGPGTADQTIPNRDDDPVSVVDAVRSELAAVLGITPAGDVDLKESLFDLGVDSMLAVDLRKRLKRTIGRTVPLRLLLDELTGDELVAKLESAGEHYGTGQKVDISRD
ncbi:mycobactin polyketide synthase MbtD [Mycobacterium camsae]|uniref:mycobactin polyketide synthase MbtD n=1 Tax=Mycobacterium gordonae TaxID=1778 RepID=UPI00197F6987|nr:mycobactin polyketide synthase MbtD [Mycobacterium gordonae]